MLELVGQLLFSLFAWFLLYGVLFGPPGFMSSGGPFKHFEKTGVTIFYIGSIFIIGLYVFAMFKGGF